MTAQILMYLGGAAWLFGLATLIGTVTSMRFVVTADGVERGIPLATGWFYVALYAVLGAAFWFGGPSWYHPRFVGLRERRPWLVPVVGTFVLFPALVMFIFVLAR